MDSDDIKLPTLDEVSKQEVVKFFKKYRTYEADVEIINRNRTGENRHNKRLICECIDPDLLEEIMEKLMIEAHDEDLNTSIVSYLENVLKEESFDSQKLKLQEDLAKISLNTKNEQAEARVLMFKKDLRRVLKENGMVPNEIFQDESIFGSIVKMLIENGRSLNPPEVRAWIKNLLDGKRGKMIIEDVKMLTRLATSYGYISTSSTNNAAQVSRYNRPIERERPSNQISNFAKRKIELRGNENAKRVNFDLSANSNPKNSQSNSNTKVDQKEVTCWGCNAKGHSLNLCTVITDKEERAKFVSEKLKASKTQSRNNTHKVKQYIDVEDISCMLSKKEDALTACVVKLDGINCNVILDLIGH
jgi:hypothetical protein